MTSATNIPVHVRKNRTAGDWVVLALLIIGGLVMLFPFIVLLLNAFKTTADYNSSGPLSWPQEFSADGLMKKKTSMTLSVGLEIGNTILRKMVQRLAPSMVAASRIDLGNVP